MADLGVWIVDSDAPQAVPVGTHVELEEKFEDWIVANPALLPGDLRIIGRQVRLEGGALDLLALDWQRRWVVIEIKRGRLRRAVVAQAIDYATSIEQLGGAELEATLLPPHATLLDVDGISSAVRQQLQAESGADLRDVQVMVVGIGTDSGLDRIADYLKRFEVPLSVVSFRVFERADGPSLLVRDVTDEQPEPPTAQSKYSMEPIRRKAVEAGVEAQFDRVVAIAREASLRIQPRKHAVRIAVPSDARHRLIYARPEADGLTVGVSPDKFAAFYPMTEDAVSSAIDMERDGETLAGVELDARLDQIEAFLQTLPSADEEADER